MKKKGFSLAELMIAMGVVGVVAAITIPMLVENAQRAQIGPKLAKAVSAFEQATAATLHEYEVERISDFGFEFGNNNNTPGSFLADYISKHLKLTLNNYNGGAIRPQPSSCIAEYSKNFTGDFQTPDGTIYLISHWFPANLNVKPHQSIKGYLGIDINGHSKPNKHGSDIFMFALYDDGSLRPMGGDNWNEGLSSCSWKTDCATNQEPKNPHACAGHIFENNLKVLYKQ